MRIPSNIRVAAFWLLAAGLLTAAGCSGQPTRPTSTNSLTTSSPQPVSPVATSSESGAANAKTKTESLAKVKKSKEEWRKQLSAKQFYVTREQGTERAFTGEYWDNKKEGVYNCVCCGLPLFSSQTKYKSGTGWPSFWRPIKRAHVAEESDNSLFMVRTEVKCARCEAHLGHVFDDGPDPTGLRYCLNSAALNFAGGKVAKEEPADNKSPNKPKGDVSPQPKGAVSPQPEPGGEQQPARQSP